jgi:hypothetical protein
MRKVATKGDALDVSCHRSHAAQGTGELEASAVYAVGPFP